MTTEHKQHTPNQALLREAGEAGKARETGEAGKAGSVSGMPDMSGISGVLVINKPKGPTSAGCLAAIKRRP
jgi:tRNA pseudouridine synthase B (EC 4.2.1.70)